nr:unnamed protein product [Spirometra erinaceieuropaei]
MHCSCVGWSEGAQSAIRAASELNIDGGQRSCAQARTHARTALDAPPKVGSRLAETIVATVFSVASAVPCHSKGCSTNSLSQSSVSTAINTSFISIFNQTEPQQPVAGTS